MCRPAPLCRVVLLPPSLILKWLLSACNFSRFICTLISDRKRGGGGGAVWATASEDPPLAATRRLSNENIIHPVTSELQEMVCWQFSGSLELREGRGVGVEVGGCCGEHET